MKRLFQLTSLKTGKRTGSYYEKKKLAKATRNSLYDETKEKHTVKVSVGPDHWRYKDGR